MLQDLSRQKLASGSSDLMVQLLDLVGDVFIVLDTARQIVVFNPAAEALFDLPASAAVGKPLDTLLPETARGRVNDALHAARTLGPVEPPDADQRQLTLLRPNGDPRRLRITTEWMVLPSGGFYLLVLHDITDRHRLEGCNQRLRQIVEEAAEEVYIVDPGSWKLMLINRRARDNLGFGTEDLARLTLPEISPPLTASHLESLILQLERGLHPGGVSTLLQTESIHQRRNGSTYEVNARIQLMGAADQRTLVMMALDTSEKAQYESYFLQQSLYDPVTMLPNRSLFRERVERLLQNHQRSADRGAVLLINVDNIGLVNDGLGASAADELVREIAHRLSATVRARDTVARLGDNDFAILACGLDHQQDAGVLAERVLADLRRPVSLSGYQVVVPAVIGISTFPDDGLDQETLLRNANTALVGAREDAVVNYRYYTGALNLVVKNRVAINSGLSRAMERNEFSLVYQPRVDIATWRVLGVEALLRWRNLDLGPVPPDEFVPVLERTGLITEVGGWVLETACRQRRLLKEAGYPEVRMAVNLSVRQIRREFLTGLRAALVNSGLEPGDLELEVTESVIIKDGQGAVELLREVSAMGVHIAMDDFGCGYSSLSHLRKLPLTILKIDRSFINDIATDADDTEIVKAIISMGHALRLRVVAEGVETVQQLGYLSRFGCDEIQGYLYSPPVPPDELMSLLANAALAPSPL
ncbi:diguanylate cyclase [Azospirillaceae bacterium]